MIDAYEKVLDSSYVGLQAFTAQASCSAAFAEDDVLGRLNITAPVANRTHPVIRNPHFKLAGRYRAAEFVEGAPQPERQRHKKERQRFFYFFSAWS